MLCPAGHHVLVDESQAQDGCHVAVPVVCDAALRAAPHSARSYILIDVGTVATGPGGGRLTDRPPLHTPGRAASLKVLDKAAHAGDLEGSRRLPTAARLPGEPRRVRIRQRDCPCQPREELDARPMQRPSSCATPVALVASSSSLSQISTRTQPNQPPLLLASLQLLDEPHQLALRRVQLALMRVHPPAQIPSGSFDLLIIWSIVTVTLCGQCRTRGRGRGRTRPYSAQIPPHCTEIVLLPSESRARSPSWFVWASESLVFRPVGGLLACRLLAAWAYNLKGWWHETWEIGAGVMGGRVGCGWFVGWIFIHRKWV